MSTHLSFRNLRTQYGRLAATGALLSTLFVATMNVATETGASASTSCTSLTYGGYEDLSQTDRYTGVEGDINYEHDDFILSDDNSDHAALWIGNDSRHDPNANSSLYIDWVQAGYFVGTADNDTEDTTVVYGEANWPTNPNESAGYGYLWVNTTLGWGNNYFTSYYTGTTSTYDGTTYGLYEEFDGTTQVASSYMIVPDKTAIEANLEGLQVNGSYCPNVAHGMIGTNGDQSSPGSSQATVLEFQKAQGGGWTNWTSTTAPDTDDLTSSPYSTTDYQSYSAFDSNGGG
jgi:hypothetical protein